MRILNRLLIIRIVMILCCALCVLSSCKQQEDITIELPEIVIEGAIHDFRDTSVHLVDSSQLQDENIKTHPTSSEIQTTDTQIIPDPKIISDTTHHFYVNNKLSVKITPWNEGKRQIILYDLYGNIIYTHEEVKLSYRGQYLAAYNFSMCDIFS